MKKAAIPCALPCPALRPCRLRRGRPLRRRGLARKAQRPRPASRAPNGDMSMDMSYTIVTVTTHGRHYEHGHEHRDRGGAPDRLCHHEPRHHGHRYGHLLLHPPGGRRLRCLRERRRRGWTRQDLPEDQIAQYNAVESVEFYLSVADSFAYTGEEERDGVKLYRYDGELSGDQLGRAVELSGMDEMLSSYGAGADTVFQGSMPMSIWLDAETFAPVRYEFDMSQIVGGFVQGVFESEGAGLENSSVSVSLDLSEFDAIDSIEAPAGIE